MCALCLRSHFLAVSSVKSEEECVSQTVSRGELVHVCVFVCACVVRPVWSCCVILEKRFVQQRHVSQRRNYKPAECWEVEDLYLCHAAEKSKPPWT